MATTWTFTLRAGVPASAAERDVWVNGSPFDIDRALSAGGGSFVVTEPTIAARLIDLTTFGGKLLDVSVGSVADPTPAVSGDPVVVSAGGVLGKNVSGTFVPLAAQSGSGAGLVPIALGGNMGASKTIATAGESVHADGGILNANCEVTLTGKPAGQPRWIKISGVQDATGGRTLTVDGEAVGIPTTANAPWEVIVDWSGTTSYIYFPGGSGVQGPPGEDGTPGGTGPTGPPGLNWRGAWVSGTTYALNDAVSNAGSSYRRTSAGAGTTAPGSDTSNWAVLASKGDAGAGTGDLINPMTTAGDIIVATTGGAPTRVAKGAVNTSWGVNGAGVLGYKADPSGGGSGSITKLRTNSYHAPAAGVTYNDLNPGIGEERAAPIEIPFACTVIEISVWVTQAGSAGAKLRLGIRPDDGTMFPGTLLLDAGQVTADVLGDRPITISQALTPGLWWPTVTGQVASGVLIAAQSSSLQIPANTKNEQPTKPVSGFSGGDGTRTALLTSGFVSGTTYDSNKAPRIVLKVTVP